MQHLLDSFGLSDIYFNGDWYSHYQDISNKIYYNKSLNMYIYHDTKYNIINEYSVIRTLSEFSGYNKIELCWYNNSLVIIRSTKTNGFGSILESFVENIKTIYLYCWQKHNYPDFKIFPDIYGFGYNKLEGKYYLIQEYIYETVSANIRKPHVIQNLMPKLLKIFDHLSIIKFRHGDLTFNNILIQDGAPIIIDFGFSSFFINNIWFTNVSNDIINYCNKYNDIYNNKLIRYNIMHDLIIFMHSLRGYILPNIYFHIYIPGRVFRYFIRIFSKYTTDINKDLPEDIAINIRDTIYFDEPGSLNLAEHAKIFMYISPHIYNIFRDRN